MSAHHGDCEPDWALNGLDCPYGRSAGAMGATFTWPNNASFIDGVAMFYSGPVFFCAIYFPVLAMLLTFCGQFSVVVAAVPLMAIFSNMGFKHLARDIRPEGGCLTSCGMPSGHSQLTIAVAAFVLLEVFSRPRLHRGIFWLAIALVVVLLVPVPWSRVQLGDHSVAQVLVGSAVGILEALLWFLIVRLVLMRFMPALDKITEWSRFFLRDDYTPKEAATPEETERLVKATNA
eukprot:CAMPEP_0178401916 /NCGR_PEP_ID=MMETSP0689_2-20121128/16560_1 /TAXON_ID=160604 /ORGANISM="Amphidinium massartii, Strain CS-259" /LENGTH=232 /DNA_ID=CAMNT_0020022775 /DNA_START=43 /DNA_END=741 /DNA_ORIENTATION=-